ncbi:hypothetical protein [Sphingomonas koreensis]
MRFIQFTRQAALIAAAIIAAPVHACPPPPPEPQPPAAPNIAPLAGEDAEAYRLRVAPLVETHKQQLAAFHAEKERNWVERARHIQAAQRLIGGAQDTEFDKAGFALVAHVGDRTPLPPEPGSYLPRVRLQFQADAMLKGKGKIGPLAYVARNGMLTSCGGFDPGIEGDPDGYLIVLDKQNPGTLDPRWILPIQSIRSPRLKTLVADARAAAASRKRR